MSPRPLAAALTLAAATSLSLTALPARAASDPAPSDWVQLTDTYTATAKYAYEPFAKDGGYVPIGGCAASAEGGVGYRYVNMGNIGSLDPAKPAALLYADEEQDPDGVTAGLVDDEDDAGSDARELVGVEWIVPNSGQATPALFGQTFRTDRLSGYYTLDAWLYRPSPQGLLGAANPEVTCPAAS
ncbi:hypothetical protein ACYF6T_34515 [Streptomyces sp. 7R007]